MDYVLVLITALVVSMAVIPIMIRWAPSVGMIDLPDPRKVHAVPIPRVGGVGVFAGAIVAMLMFVPMDKIFIAYLSGAAVLFCFGLLDDCHELGHYVKFIGQFIAAVAVVYWGGLWVSLAPFLGQPLPDYVGKPFTVIAIVGMINAINHSDGLDGLAGGESLLSLGCIAYLAFLAGGIVPVVMACAVIGGVIGFLRFNTHPAKVFMGDSGSQFLGFTLGVFAVWLTQKVNTGLSMALPALILGLPIVDILAVFAQRVYQRRNWFLATRNHIHHRLLELGFDHYQAVLIIYAVQAFLVMCAVLFSYESDWFVLAIYLGVCALIFVLLTIGERISWKANRGAAAGPVAGMRNAGWLKMLPRLFVKISIPVYFLLGSFLIAGIPQSFQTMLFWLGAILAVGWVLRATSWAPYMIRFAVYGAAAFWVYLTGRDIGPGEHYFAVAGVGYFALLAAAIALVMRFSRDAEFKATTMDFLMVVMIVAAGLLSRGFWHEYELARVIVETAVLFYGCELIISREDFRWGSLLNLSVMFSLVLVGLRLAI